MLAVSLDGRLAPPAGGAAQIGGPGDRRALEEALAWCDAALLGAETLRRHGTTCLLRQPDLLALRAAAGRPPQPIAIVASRSGRLDPDLPFFRQPLERWLLGPAGAAPPFQRHMPLRRWADTLAELGGLGIARLALLGGASLAGALAAEGWIDELQLSLCPRLLGGPHAWLPADAAPLPGRDRGWRLVELRRLEGEEVLLRYRLPSV